MTTRSDLRTALDARLVALEDGGYGDFEFTDAEKNLYLDLAVSQLYPAIYKKVSEEGLAWTLYGSYSDRCYIEPAFPDRVFAIQEDGDMDYVTGWQIRPDKIVGLSVLTNSATTVTTFTVYYHDAYTLPADDVTAIGVSDVYKPLIVQGALIYALESRQDTGVRPDPSNGYQWAPLLDRLQRHYDSMRAEMAMALPAVMA